MSRHLAPLLRVPHRSLSSLPSSLLLRRLAAIDGLQNSYATLENQLLREQRALERDFKRKASSIFSRRQQIVCGNAEPTDEEVAASEGGLFAEEGELGEPPDELREAKGIPGFWKGVIMGADLRVDGETVVNKKDWAVLEALIEVRIEPWIPPAAHEPDEETPLVIEPGNGTGSPPGLDQEEGFALIFAFGPNEFLDSGVDGSAEISLFCNEMGDVEQVWSPIWRQGQDPTVQQRVKKRKQKGGKGSKGTKTEERVVVTKPVNSFFRIFELPDGGDDEDFDENLSDEQHDLSVLPAHVMQSELVVTLAEDVIPNAGAYYLRSLAGAEADLDGDELDRY